MTDSTLEAPLDLPRDLQVRLNSRRSFKNGEPAGVAMFNGVPIDWSELREGDVFWLDAGDNEPWATPEHRFYSFIVRGGKHYGLFYYRPASEIYEQVPFKPYQGNSYGVELYR